jgi:hypothetical protein
VNVAEIIHTVYYMLCGEIKTNSIQFKAVVNTDVARIFARYQKFALFLQLTFGWGEDLKFYPKIILRIKVVFRRRS